MVKKIIVLICITLVMPLMAIAQEVAVTRNFTSEWNQTNHESQGISLRAIHLAPLLYGCPVVFTF